MKNFIKKGLTIGVCVLCFSIGVIAKSIVVTEQEVFPTMSINGVKVNIVDIMYTYTNEEGEIIEGDYSIVSDNGYEYCSLTTYNKGYEGASIKINTYEKGELNEIE